MTWKRIGIGLAVIGVVSAARMTIPVAADDTVYHTLN